MGHVVRCLALADYLKKNYKCKIHFAMRRSELGVNKVKSSYSVFQSDESEFNYKYWLSDCISKSNAEILIMDMRDGLARDELKQLKKKTGIKVVTIDDLEDKRLEADLAFYPPINQLKKMNWDGYNGKLLIGWKYVLLREEFVKSYPKSNNIIPNILITMGATDEKNITSFVVEALNKLNEKFHVSIIVGIGYPHLDHLKNILDMVQYKYKLFIEPNNMAEIMSKSDLAIISFGVTAYELAALNTPAVYLCLSDDHEMSANLFKYEGVGKIISKYSKINKEEFITTLSSLLKNQKILSAMSLQASSINVSDLEEISNCIIGKRIYA